MVQSVREQILHLIESDSRLCPAEIATMVGITEGEAEEEIEQMEKEHIICGYHTLINWAKAKEDDITAMIELRVTPQDGDGYEKIAEYISQFPQVETLYLMSGAYDFLVTIKGKTLKEISLFVSGKLASMKEVQSTTTHFALTKYKELGVDMEAKKIDERMVITP
ncbi:transcriptional regulator, AsnC family [Lachnospiraceae bacterium KM106-2]|nr:transcriptional regulator, AsnC family [Lachnospiraceae bacterium KM106-2]